MPNNESSCLGKLLKVIDILQRNAEQSDACDETCTRPILGTTATISCFNTRPISLYNCQNTLLTLEYQVMQSGEPITRTSSVFRVEKVENNCCTVSILEANTATTDPTRAYISTGQYATINLGCMCVLRCLPDIVIDCL